METTLRTTTAGGTGSIPGTRAGASTRLVQPRAAEPTTEAGSAGQAAAAGTSAPAPLRSNAASVGSALQDQVARAQQALDYLDRVQSQLESLKGELSSRLASTRGTVRQQADSQASTQLAAQVRQLASTLASRTKNGGGGIDSNLHFTGKPATQRFRIRGLDLDTLRSGGAQSLAFSVGGAGGPQLSVDIDPGMSDKEIAAAIDRAMAPMGVRAGLDDQRGLVFSTPESNWPAVKDSIAISGRGRVATEEVPPELAPQQWNTNGNGGDSLRASLREVVQALERVRRSRDAASNALSAATVQMTQATTPPPEAEEAAQEFASTAANPDYESLLSLTSALVGVSRERVLALLGLR